MFIKITEITCNNVKKNKEIIYKKGEEIRQNKDSKAWHLTSLSISTRLPTPQLYSVCPLLIFVLEVYKVIYLIGRNSNCNRV